MAYLEAQSLLSLLRHPYLQLHRPLTWINSIDNPAPWNLTKQMNKDKTETPSLHKRFSKPDWKKEANIIAMARGLGIFILKETHFQK